MKGCGGGESLKKPFNFEHWLLRNKLLLMQILDFSPFVEEIQVGYKLERSSNLEFKLLPQTGSLTYLEGKPV